MSLTAALNAAISGLRVSQAQVQLVSSNVAHVNDPTYTKKKLIQESAYLGNNQIGGTLIAGYQSAISVALRKQYESYTSRDGLNQTQSEYMSRIQTLLGTNSDTAALPKLMSQFTAAWQSFQTQPESAAAQRQIISIGDQLASEIRRLSTGLDDIENQIKQDIGDTTTELNDLLAKVFEVNLRIKSADPNGTERLELIDQRDQLVREVANLVDVRTVERENGSIALITPSGMSLLDGAPARFRFDGTNIISLEGNQVVNPMFREGKLKALLDLRADGSSAGQPASADPAKEVFRKLRSQLDVIVGAFTGTTGNPPTFAAAYNNGATSLRITASHQTTVTAGPGNAQMGTVSLTGSLNEGDVFEVTVKGKTFSYTATQNDTNLDQVAQKLAALVNADTTLGVTAINGVASLQLVGQNNDEKFTVVSSVNGQLPELSGGFFEGTDRYNFKINADLLGGFQQLKKNAAPDVVNAINSSERSFVAVGLSLTSVSYKGLMSGFIGTAANNAKVINDGAELSGETLKMTEQRYLQDTGVNLDEELANLQVLQNAYAASARLMTVIQTLFDTLQAAVTR